MKGVCEPCGKDCLRCTSEGEQCTACKWGYFLPPVNRKDCVKECPKGEYILIDFSFEIYCEFSNWLPGALFDSSTF